MTKRKRRFKEKHRQYSKTPIYCKPRFTAANFFPQKGLNMHIVNKQYPDLPRTPIYRGRFLSPKPAVNQGFIVSLIR